MLDPADVHELSTTQSIDGFRNRKMTTHFESGYLHGDPDIPMQLALGKHLILIGGTFEPVSMIINTTNRHFNQLHHWIHALWDRGHSRAPASPRALSNAKRQPWERIRQQTELKKCPNHFNCFLQLLVWI